MIFVFLLNKKIKYFDFFYSVKINLIIIMFNLIILNNINKLLLI